MYKYIVEYPSGQSVVEATSRLAAWNRAQWLHGTEPVNIWRVKS